MDNLTGGFSTPFGAVEIAVKADDLKAVFFCGRVMVGVVKIEIESLYNVDDTFCILRLKAKQPNSPVYQGILYEP